MAPQSSSLLLGILTALHIGEARQVADGQRPLVTKDGGASIAGYGVAGTEVADGNPADVDTVCGVVGDRNAPAKIEIGALLYGDADSTIAADGSGEQDHRRVFPGGDTAAGLRKAYQ